MTRLIARKHLPLSSSIYGTVRVTQQAPKTRIRVALEMLMLDSFRTI